MREPIAWLRDLVTGLADAFWALVALLFDTIGDASALSTALLATLLIASALGLAHLSQRRLVRRIRCDPSRRLRWAEHELWFFLPAWLFLPFVLLARAVAMLWRWLVGFVRRRGRRDETEKPQESPDPPYLAASLGPSYLFAGLVTTALYLVARLAEPLLAARLGLAAGTPAWEHLLIGHRPELAPHLPLARTSPFLAAFASLLLWLTVWGLTARLVRLFNWRHLGGDLLVHRDRPSVLPSWRDWAAVPRLWAPATPYRAWAGTLAAVALPLLVWGWFSLGDLPYRSGVGHLTVAWTLWLAWATHLTLSGDERTGERKPDSPGETTTVEPGWPEVAADLAARLQLAVPEPLRPQRRTGGLRWTDQPVTDDPYLSPLLAELIPEHEGRRRLTDMQRTELHRLSRLGHVFTRPAPVRGELALGERETTEELDVRERNRIVLAPEGIGKTTLGLLAAANHALVHTRASLLITRDEATARELHERIEQLLDPSSLRWNLRLRLAGSDLVDDFTRGIVPDLVITSLRHLTLRLLNETDTYAPLLHRLGLIVVDDVESYAGTVETHARLAFHRLRLTARKLLGVEQFGQQGEKLAPLVLALGGESMHKMPVWIESLIGIDAEVERYAPAEADGRHQQFFLLSDFRASTGERLVPSELVASCERLGVAWHYRPASDGRRHLGRMALQLPEDTRGHVSDPCRAAVVLVEGAWSEVRRELDRLSLAGSRHPATPCAILGCIDPDEEMSFRQHDDRLSLAAEITTLPRPVVRPATGRTVGSHLASDLTQSWTEVADVLDTFGNASALKLRQLADEGLLLTERRIDVDPERNEYVEKVYVRALANAVADPEAGDPRAPLPPRVSEVELASRHALEVIDRTDMDRIDRVDADSAGLAYYPGRVFADARGRFIVVHHASEETGDRDDHVADSEREAPAGSILVEPLLGDDVSTPRRRVLVERVLLSGETGSRHAADPSITGHAFYGPDPVRIGEQPIAVELALVELRSRHHATYLLGPTFCEVRQRRLFTGDGVDELRETRLTTVALRLYPNPRPQSDGDEDDVPRLTVRQARLVTAAMRAVLPSMYRGARDELAVALNLHDDRPDPEHVLTPEECILLFDLHSLGNGIARAIHRDGVELLLRLTRMHLERVLYHDRLVALHDHWSDGSGERGLYADWPAEEPAMAEGDEATGGGPTPADLTRRRRQHEESLRHQALEWLDSRLRPEGDAAAFSGSLGRHERDAERGEGDVIDIGRCWYSGGSSVSDLAWAKHRWRLPDGDEVMLDVAFDRTLLGTARHLTADADPPPHGVELHLLHLADPAFALNDGRVWGAPRAVWRVEGEKDQPHSSQPELDGEPTRTLHERIASVAGHDHPLLGPLARKLRRYASLHAANRQAWGGDDRYHLATYVASFVQGIPTVPWTGDEAPKLRSALIVLLERRGNPLEKALLSCLLLEACGIPASLMVSLGERRALAAAALFEPIDARPSTVAVHRDEEGRFASAESSTGNEERYVRGLQAAREMWQHVESWADSIQLSAPPRFWCELPMPRPDGDDESPIDESSIRLYLPVETAALRWPGQAVQHEPESWLCLPLVSVLHHLDEHPLQSAENDEGSPR